MCCFLVEVKSCHYTHQSTLNTNINADFSPSSNIELFQGLIKIVLSLIFILFFKIKKVFCQESIHQIDGLNGLNIQTGKSQHTLSLLPDFPPSALPQA